MAAGRADRAGAGPGRRVELCAGLREEGQGCGQVADLGGKRWPLTCLSAGLSGCMGYRGQGWVRWDVSRIERRRLEDSWVPGWGGGPRREVINAERKIDFCLQRTEAGKGLEVSS